MFQSNKPFKNTTFTKYKIHVYIQPHDSRLQFMNIKDRLPAKQRMSAIDDDDDDDDDDHNLEFMIGKGVDERHSRKTTAKWRLMVLMNMNTAKVWRVMVMIWWREELKREEKDDLMKRREERGKEWEEKRSWGG